MLQFRRSLVFAQRPGSFRNSNSYKLFGQHQGHRLSCRVTPGETRDIEELATPANSSGLNGPGRELAQQFQTEVPLECSQSRTDQPYNKTVGHDASAHKPTVPKVPVLRHTSDEARSRAARHWHSGGSLAGHCRPQSRPDPHATAPGATVFWGDGSVVHPPRSRNNHRTLAFTRKISLELGPGASFRFLLTSPAGNEVGNYGSTFMSPGPGPLDSPLARSSSCSSTRPEVCRAFRLTAIQPHLPATLLFKPHPVDRIRLDSNPLSVHQFNQHRLSTHYSYRHYSSTTTKSPNPKTKPPAACYFEKPSNTAKGLKIYNKMLSNPIVNRTALHPQGVA